MEEVPPPPPPTPVAGLPEEEQARILMREYADAMSWGAELAVKHRELTSWIKRLLQERSDGH